MTCNFQMNDLELSTRGSQGTLKGFRQIRQRFTSKLSKTGKKQHSSYGCGRDNDPLATVQINNDTASDSATSTSPSSQGYGLFPTISSGLVEHSATSARASNLAAVTPKNTSVSSSLPQETLLQADLNSQRHDGNAIRPDSLWGRAERQLATTNAEAYVVLREMVGLGKGRQLSAVSFREFCDDDLKRVRDKQDARQYGSRQHLIRAGHYVLALASSANSMARLDPSGASALAIPAITSLVSVSPASVTSFPNDLRHTDVQETACSCEGRVR